MAHSAALILFAVQDFYCRGHRCLRPGFDPDAYASLARLLGSGRPEIRSATILYEMCALIMLCAASFVAAKAWTVRDLRRGDRSYVGALLYRWLGPYVRDVRGGEGVITAYVLTKMRHEGMALGYRGVVNEVSLNADGEINSITLYAVERFGLLLGTTPSPDQRTPALSGLLGLVHIPGREIENVALTAFTFADAEAAEPAGGAMAAIGRDGGQGEGVQTESPPAVVSERSRDTVRPASITDGSLFATEARPRPGSQRLRVDR